jgi:hypothetical protein
MHSVAPVTMTGPSADGLGFELPRQDVRRRTEKAAQLDWTGARVRAALACANQPLRARVLAHMLGLSSTEVRAALRRLQDRGAAVSHGRRWTAVTEP